MSSYGQKLRAKADKHNTDEFSKDFEEIILYIKRKCNEAAACGGHYEAKPVWINKSFKPKLIKRLKAMGLKASMVETPDQIEVMVTW